MSPSKKKRIDLLDGWRTVAVLTMVVWHVLWDMTAMFGMLPSDFMRRDNVQLTRYFIVFSFLLLSGISCHFSRSNIRRGLQTAGCAAVITLVTYLIGDPAKFGILHLFAACMLLYGWLGKWFAKIPDLWAGGLSLGVFCVLWIWLDTFRVGFDWLFPLGFRSIYFYSSDYYPVLPWFFLFLFGTVLGRRIAADDGRWKEIALPRAITWPGRHALLIYMLHQPLIVAVLTLVQKAAA